MRADSGLLALLSPAERRRYSAYWRAPDRGRFLAGCCLLRLVLGATWASRLRRCWWSVPAGAVAGHMASRGLPAGKPAARLEVSVSHAGDRVAVAVCRGLAVGVDVEEVRADLDVDAIAPDVLAAEEVAWLAQLDQPDRRAAFVELWARKEAVLKGLGVGLEAPPRDLRVSGLGRRRLCALGRLERHRPRPWPYERSRQGPDM